jgi:hypothetical protein
MSARRLRTVLSAFAAVLVVALAASTLRASSAWLYAFSIDDQPTGAYAVLSDSARTGTSEYRDYRLGSGQETDLNFCVETAPLGGGGLFLRLNRAINGDTSTPCYTPAHIYSDGPERQFSLIISDEMACLDLGAYGYLSTPSWSAPCAISGGPSPRIRESGDLWARKPRVTIDFLTRHPNGGSVDYEIQSTGSATILNVPNTPNVKIATYSGTGQLVRFGTGSPVPVGAPFRLPFHITFVRLAQ